VARGALLCLVVLGWLGSSASATPAARQRVVLADLDPELRHAMEQVLAPWHLEVVIESAPPTDSAMAQARADADTARFVVWREGAQLVVYDRELEFIERRDSRSGMLDPPTAAAAALTIKTMMRLPPPPAPEPAPALEPAPVVSSNAIAAEPGIELRLQAGAATRLARSNATEVSARFGGVAQIRPLAGSGWRFGIAADGGTPTAVSRASFKGTWRDWALMGVVSWTYAIDAWEIEPHAAGGVRRSVLRGSEMDTPRSEDATLGTARGGLWVRYRLAHFTLGAALDVDGSFGTPTYNKIDTPAVIFQVPGVGVELGAVVAVDL
jgi:hypothetical protein